MNFPLNLSEHLILILAATSAERQVKEVEAQANLLFDRLKPLKMLEENLSRNLSEIKELISQARKQAASVSTSFSKFLASGSLVSLGPPQQKNILKAESLILLL